MRKARSFYLALAFTVIVASIVVVLSTALQGTNIISGSFHTLLISTICNPVPQIYTILNTNASVNSIVIDVTGANLYIEGVKQAI